MTKVGKKTTGGTHGGDGPSTSGRSVGGSRGRKQGRDYDDDEDDPNKAERQGVKMHHQNQWWPARNHARRAQFTHPPTESYQPSTYLVRRREPCWIITCWTGLRSRRGRYKKARMQGRQVKPHRYRAGTVALQDIPHFQKTSALLIRK